jgi:hypothetical protein
MPISVSMTVAQLKALFESGDKPTGADFANLIESTYGRDQLLQFNPVSGDLGISTSDGAPYNIVNIAGMLDANLSFTYNNATRKLTITRNGTAIVLGPFDGPWTVSPTSNKAYASRWIGIGNSNPGYPLHVTGNAKIEGKTTVTGDLFADKDLQIQDNLRFGGYGEEVERITDEISTATSSSRALTTENAVLAFVKKHTWQHVLLWDLVQSMGSGSHTLQLDSAGALVWDSSYSINPSNHLVIPVGADGVYRIEAFTHYTSGGNNQGRYGKIYLRAYRGTGQADYPMLFLVSDSYEKAATGAFELRLSGLDRIALIMENDNNVNNISARISVKRLPDPIL